MYHPHQHQPMLGPMVNPSNANANIVDPNKFSNMFGALSAAAAANFASAVVATNFASCPASTSTSTSNSSHFPGGQQSIPSSIVSTIPVSGPSFGPPPLQATKRERTKYSEYQLAYLEGIFRELNYPDSAKREEIARILELTDVKVQVWFKNRRAKMRNERKFEQMKKEAAKVAANRKRNNTIGSVKREESVEDTEEEDPGKGLGKGEMGMTKPGADSVKQNSNGNNLKTSNSPSISSIGQFVGVSKSESPSTMNAFGPSHHQWSTNHQIMPMEMGSLMQMAAASSAAAVAAGQSQNFYSGCWTNSAQSNNATANYNTTNYSFLPPPYAGQMMFSNAMAAYYPPTAAGQYNYYFPVQQTATTEQAD